MSYLAVITYQYRSNPKAIPPRWPAEVIEIETIAMLPQETGWVCMTKKEYSDHIAMYQIDYDNWEKAQLNQQAYLNYIDDKVTKAQEQGAKLAKQFTISNVMLGITQAGMTSKVRKTLSEVYSCLITGSLYDAITEIRLIPDSALDARFITKARMLVMINEIQDYLGTPRTTS